MKLEKSTTPRAPMSAVAAMDMQEPPMEKWTCG